MKIRYTVVCTLKDANVVENYLTWLKDVHIKDVIALGGALSAEVLIRGRNSMEYISMYMYTCVYIHVYIYMYIYTYICINLYVFLYTYEKVHIL
jgi:hypothetical protein